MSLQGVFECFLFQFVANRLFLSLILLLNFDRRLSRSYDGYALPPVQEAQPSYQPPRISQSFDAIHQQQSFAIRRRQDPPQQLVTYAQQPVRHFQQVPPYMPDSYGVVRDPSGRVIYGTL